jgi:nucleoside-diphosphate-sugar epimerase
LAEVIWQKIKGKEIPLKFNFEEGFKHDVQKRIPSVEKAKRILGFEATTKLDEMLDEVIPWISTAIKRGLI